MIEEITYSSSAFLFQVNSLTSYLIWHTLEQKERKQAARKKRMNMDKNVRKISKSDSPYGWNLRLKRLKAIERISTGISTARLKCLFSEMACLLSVEEQQVMANKVIPWL